LFKTTNEGSSWINFTNGFPDTAVHIKDIIFYQDSIYNKIFVACNWPKKGGVGIFESNDNGNFWTNKGSFVGPLLIKGNDLYVGSNVGLLGVYKKEIITSIKELKNVTASPEEFIISNSFPNPFNSSTTLNFRNATTKEIQVVVFDILGRPVKLLLNRNVEPGNHSISWDGKNDAGKNVSTGIYYFSFKSGSRVYNAKTVLLK
jgi:hypothetical protein